MPSTCLLIGLSPLLLFGVFDYGKLMEVVGVVTRNLNVVIDKNYYPVPETELSNKRHRPLGIGVQGLADVYCKLKIPFDSDQAKLVNEKIFACIYYSAMNTSVLLSLEHKDNIDAIVPSNDIHALILKAEKSNTNGKAGSIVSENFEVCCGEGSIKVLSIQREGKRVQQINEFLLGTQIKKGTNIA